MGSLSFLFTVKTVLKHDILLKTILFSNRKKHSIKLIESIYIKNILKNHVLASIFHLFDAVSKLINGIRSTIHHNSTKIILSWGIKIEYFI